MTMDIESIRRQFPILAEGDIIYFDNAATSLMPRQVAEAMMESDLYYRANVGRGLSRHTRKATGVFEEAREKVADFLGAEPREIVFVRNTTEAINIIACGLPWKKGDRVVTTLAEHHSNFLPWQVTAKRNGLKLEYVIPDLNDLGDLEPYDKALESKPRLLSMLYVSNVLGVRLPVAEVVRMAKERGTLTMVDAAQAAPHFPINVKELGVDYLAISAHKMYGPTGIGALYISKDAPQPQPLLVGGGMVTDVMLDEFRVAETPAGFEAGTQPIAAAVGFARAVDFIGEVGFDNIEKRCKHLTGEFDHKIRSYDRLRVFGAEGTDNRLGIFAFHIADLGVYRVASLYDQFGNIVLRSGHHCAIPLHREMLGVERGTVRASMAFYNTVEEIDRFMEVTERILELVGDA